MSKSSEEMVGPSSAGVEAYLARHPDFFQGRDELLQSLSLVQDDGNTLSLVERQVSVLRDQHTSTRRKLDELLLAAQRNNDIFNKCQTLVLNLIATGSSTAFFDALEQSFTRDFKSTAYSLIVFDEQPRQLNHFTSVVSMGSAEEYVRTLMRAKEPTLGALRPAQQDFLFRHASDKVQSAAVLAVRNEKLIALLAIGSADPDYFKPGLGTLFIGFVADALALLLPKHISH